MNLNQPTLYEFENERRSNNYIPPEASNSFYQIGEGKLDLYCIRIDPALFDVIIEDGTMHTGEGPFYINGDVSNSSAPYNSLTVLGNAELVADQVLSITVGNGDIHGTLYLADNSVLTVGTGSKLTLYPESTLVVSKNCKIIVDTGASVDIYGDINIPLSEVDSIIKNPGIYLDSIAHLNVSEIELEDRAYSLTDYEMDLRSRSINPYSQGEYDNDDGRIGYTWKNGTPVNGSQCISLSVLWGQAILGDFKLSILGTQNNVINDLQVVESLEVEKDTFLYISESYKGYAYIRPELYIGVILGNIKKPGWATIDGTVYVDGSKALISLDRGGQLIIGENGLVRLLNQSKIKSTYNNDSPVLIINGTLMIDSIDQLEGFNKNNIEFGENGKLIIVNPDDGNYKLLLSIPNGIEESKLYELFKDRIEHVEYHVNQNHGIRIDKYYEYYGRDMTNWYGGRRIEKAIYDGLIVWHDGGVIELNKDVIPWVSLKCNLYEASRLFKSYSVDDKERLKEITKQLKYAGCGNILFRFIVGTNHVDIEMNLEPIELESVINKPMSSDYIVESTNKGKLFLKNMVTNTTEDAIVNKEATMYNVVIGENEIKIDE